MISIKGATLRPDTDCAAIGDAHKLGCRGKLITKQQNINRCYAVSKNSARCSTTTAPRPTSCASLS